MYSRGDCRICGRPARAIGLCGAHYYRAKTGQPLDAPVRARHVGTLEERLWSRVVKGNDCWEWQASKRLEGYGHFSFNGKLLAAHRVSWEIHNGPIPAGLHVLHRCDNPPCVRPDHLFLGTNAENIADRNKKGRMHSKLRPDQVREIKRRMEDGEGDASIARDYPVTLSAIWLIRRGKNWVVVPSIKHEKAKG